MGDLSESSEDLRLVKRCVLRLTWVNPVRIHASVNMCVLRLIWVNPVRIHASVNMYVLKLT